MPLMHQILAQTGEWDRIEEFSDRQFGDDRLQFLIKLNQLEIPLKQLQVLRIYLILPFTMTPLNQ